MGKAGIPTAIKEQAEAIIKKFNDEELKGKGIQYVARFKGTYLYLDRTSFGKPSPICRLKYNGSIDDWDFAIYKYSDNIYSTDEFFPGDEYVDGTIVGAMLAGLEAYTD